MPRRPMFRGAPSVPKPTPFGTLREEVLLVNVLLAAKRAAIHLLKGTGSGAIDGGDNLRQVVLDDAPFNGGQRHNCQPSSGQVLLIGKGPVAGNEHLKTVALGGFQKLAILETTPTFVAGREHIMRAEMFSEPVIQVFVE